MNLHHKIPPHAVGRYDISNSVYFITAAKLQLFYFLTIVMKIILQIDIEVLNSHVFTECPHGSGNFLVPLYLTEKFLTVLTRKPPCFCGLTHYDVLADIPILSQCSIIKFVRSKFVPNIVPNTFLM
mgnify:CR=1 FL=1